MKKEILRMQEVCMGDYQPYGLTDFRLHICEGEMVNLLGLSGAGKTVLYEYFLGNITLRHGKVFYNDLECRIGERFGGITEVVCIGQESTLIPSLSVAENILIISGRRKVKGFVRMRDIYYRAKILLGHYAPELSPKMLVRDLTPAGRRMVELLRVIENEAKLVIIDDVFQGYGQSDTLRFTELLTVILQKHTAILYASHEMDFTRTLADKAVVLRKGKTIRTFFQEDYDDKLCRQLLAGVELPKTSLRSTAVDESMVFQMRGVTGGSCLKEVDMDIHAGEIVGLYDLNNRSNMELAELIIGEQPKSGGQMYLKGRLFEPKNVDHAIHANIGYMSRSTSHSSLVESMSFIDNLYLPVLKKTSFLGIFRNFGVTDYLGKEYMERLGIPFAEKDKMVKYFDAYIQRSILLTRWILFKPTLLVCLEPCENADMIMRDIIFEAFGELAQNKTAVLIASQNISELKNICDTIYVMNSEKSGQLIRI